ncbi:casein kinase I [Thraustotheca clavata]|uniref:Casein kinase I n=1 Tax=Thraustotheca clavata TaxID=74557 RepID=A0A1W0A959_9STRA|nr:casein kinase I [Thraustotheca clavata]
MVLERGTVLKQWVLGEKLGSGACSDVYEGRDAHVECIACFHVVSNGDGNVYAMKVSPIPPPTKKKRKKSHADRSADALYAEHLLYVNHLSGHAGIPVLPASGAYGEDKGYRFLVLEKLGRTLEDVKKSYGTLPEATIARIGLDLLDIFKFLHSKRIIFVDVKPENFMLNAEETQIYCVDFGIAERYIQVTGAHKAFKMAGIIGTPTFLSLNCHKGSTPSRRDDIEALLYVLLYLIKGNLPWQGAASDADGAKLKRDTSLTDLCQSLSSSWVSMLTSIRACGFEDPPDYQVIENGLESICGSKPRSKAYDWGSKSQAKKTISSSKDSLTKNDKKQKKQTEEEKAPKTSKRKPKASVIEIESDEEKPPVKSTRRLEAATRAVGAAAAANAAASIASRTRSAKQ